MKCPKCGYTFKAESQAKGGKARWRGMSKAERKRAASDAAKARWARTPNAEVSHAAPPAASDKPTAQRGGVALH